MQFTKAVKVMLGIIVVLLSIEIAYLSKLFYFGQFKNLVFRYASSYFEAPPDFHHTPLLGCNIPPANDIHTHFFHVEFSAQSITTPVEAGGGGMTSWHDELLVMNNIGEIFVATDSSITKSSIIPPQTNRALFDDALSNGSYETPYSTFKFDDILAMPQGLLASYTSWYPDQACYGMTVALLPIEPDQVSMLDVEKDADDWMVIYRSSPCLPAENGVMNMQLQMSGGRMAALDDHNILLTVGDYTIWETFPEGSNPQSLDNDYGKILKINVETSFADFFSIGHRNPQGITIDRDGNVWSVEHGPRGGDELNLITEGQNYGWPKATLGTAYTSLPIALANQYGRHDEFTAPIYSWVPSLSTSNLIQITDFDQAWDGDFLVGTLAMKRLYHLRIMHGRVLFSEPICIGRRVRYVHQHTDGMIYVWTDDNVLYTITGPMKRPQNLAAESLLALRQCTECHGVDGGGDAPGIMDIANKSTETIVTYIKNPKAINANAQMPTLGLSGQEITQIVFALKNLR